MDAQDIHFMKLALREAKKGIGRTSPNPAVGAVIVRNDEIVGKGYHHRAGTSHAEVHALHAAGKTATAGTLYVTLEPCNHTGRTPPCTQAILDSSIKRVVVGMLDPNPDVAGGGCLFLKSKGVEVSSGVLDEECREINYPFIKHVTTGRPWVIVKAGMSLDGKIATRKGHSSWITNEFSRKKVHQIRDTVDAILIGSGTAITDDPSLTTRLLHRKGKDPVRIILDTNLSVSPRSTIFTQKSSSSTMIFCGPQAEKQKRSALESSGALIRQVGLDKEGKVDLLQVLDELGKNQIMSVLVEGGSRIHGSFLRAGLADQAFMFIAPVFVGGDGISVADALGFDTVPQASRLKNVKTRRFGDDVLVEGIF